MTKTIRLIVLVLVLSGCATVRYKETYADGTVAEAYYRRIGAQSIDGFVATKDKNGKIKISLEKNRADLGQITEVLNTLINAGAKVSP